MKQRFKVEAQALGRLSTPGIIQLYDHGEFEGNPFLVMEMRKGGSSADLLVRRQLPPKQAAQLIANLADALQTAHQPALFTSISSRRTY